VELRVLGLPEAEVEDPLAFAYRRVE
jgi:hypothetical protein